MRSSLLWLALLCHLALAAGYASHTPTFEGPDENSHYEYAWHLANGRQLPLAPSLAAARGLPQTDGAVLAHHPPLYYALLAVGLAATGTDDTVFGPRANPAFGDPSSASRHLHFLHERHPSRVLLALRLFSVLLGAATVVVVHRLGRACCPGAPAVADLAALLAACLPMWSFLHGVVSNDVLAALLSTSTVLLLTRVLQAGRLGAAQALGLGALLGLAFLTKLTTLFLGGIAAIVALVVLRRGARSGAFVRTTGLVALAALTTLAVCGWWFVRNVTLYGDALALDAHDAAFQPIPVELRWSYFFGTAPWPDVVPSFLPTVFTSLLGRFGWFSLAPPAWLVWAGATVAAAALVGLARAAFDRERTHLPRHVWLLVATCALVFAGTAAFNLKAPQPQARLLFPAIGPAAVLLAAGLARLSAALPYRRVLVALPIATAAYVLLGHFAPAFDPALAPAPPEQRNLVGAITDPVQDPAVIWLEPLPAEPLAGPPTLRWRDPTAEQGTRYSLYAFDDHGRIRLATHEWTQGQLVVEGDSLVVPDAAWQMLPRGVRLSFSLRHVPRTDDERPESLPRSAGLPFTKA